MQKKLNLKLGEDIKLM